MANLKDLIVNGVSRFIGKVYSSSGFVGDLEGTASNASKVNNHTVESNVPSDAKFTDTWRGIQDNLTSDSATESLSAKQGKVLKDLVDGKASSSHTHDDRYYTESEIDSKLNGKLSISADGVLLDNTEVVITYMQLNYENANTCRATLTIEKPSFLDGRMILLVSQSGDILNSPKCVVSGRIISPTQVDIIAQPIEADAFKYEIPIYASVAIIGMTSQSTTK